MITIGEYASLSSNVYEKECSILTGHYPAAVTDISGVSIAFRSKSEINPVKQVNWYAIMDIDENMSSFYVFYCRFYLRIENNAVTDAVLAIRGTYNLPNMVTDAYCYESDVVGDGMHERVPFICLHKALAFYHKCELFLRSDRLKKHFQVSSLEIKVTGHSLGGAVAQLVLLRAGYSTISVVFNSPGCGHMPGTPDIIKNKKYHDRHIHNINARYDVVSKIGIMIGTQEIIDVPEGREEAKLFYVDSKVSQTKTGNFWKELESERIEEQKLSGQRPEQCGKLAWALYEQHSMNNMVKALHNTPYIANKRIL